MMTHHVSIARLPSLMDFYCKNLTWIYAYLIGWLRKTQSICQRCFSLYFSTLCLWTSVQNQTTQNKHLSRKQEAAFSVDRLPPCLFHLSLSGLSHCRWHNKCFWQSSSSGKTSNFIFWAVTQIYRKWACRHFIWFNSSPLANAEQTEKPGNWTEIKMWRLLWSCVVKAGGATVLLECKRCRWKNMFNKKKKAWVRGPQEALSDKWRIICLPSEFFFSPISEKASTCVLNTFNWNIQFGL